MDIKFTGKRILVTGAAGTIGRAITELLVKCGATVIAFDISKERLQAVFKNSPNIIQVGCDLMDWSATKEAVTKNLPFDMLVNNAGQAISKPFVEYDPVTIDKHFDVNLKGAINVSQVAIKDWIRRKHKGIIVNMSSVAGSGGTPNSAIYSMSKAALMSLTENLAIEYGPQGIRVNAVRPGPIESPLLAQFYSGASCKDLFTPRTPTGRLSNAQDIASTVCFLLSDKASNMTGAQITVDGGITVHCC